MVDHIKPHIVIGGIAQTFKYKTTGGGSPLERPQRNRLEHGRKLINEYTTAWSEAETELETEVDSTRDGMYLEFISDPGFPLPFVSLENRTQGLKLLNVREHVVESEGNGQALMFMLATIFVPKNKKNFFLDKLNDYINENTSKGKPKNAPLIESISKIRKALLVEAFWTDEIALMPDSQMQWVEVWLSNDNLDVISVFEKMMEDNDIEVKEGVIKFPERSVKVILANQFTLEKISMIFDGIAEYRQAKTTASNWVELPNYDQAQWVNNLTQRLTFQRESNASVCILDTGVNSGHPLLSGVLSQEDCQSVKEEWGVHDHSGHGTNMAGIITYGDLEKCLESHDSVVLKHSLESIKILPPLGQMSNPPELWGYITSQAISLAEVQAPQRLRTICMPINADDSRDRGKPTSWSASIDQLSSGESEEGQRLIILSAGNISASITDAAQQYPDIQATDTVRDPAQSWNALTVGAFTRLNEIFDQEYANYNVVAPKNGLSPFSTTSLDWEENKWPIKPELLLEGGNLGVDETGFTTECADLSLLTTHDNPSEGQFTYFNMTSAASAQLAWMSAQLRSAHPNFWPETVRALLVHSATWPEKIKEQFLLSETKTDYKTLLKVCGYGVPNLDKAMHSAQNSLTLIAQESLQPYDKGEGRYITRDMHFYDLPWPKETLLSLSDDVMVEMRITLSYFIEPGPGEVGWKERYRYPSHGLRFELNSPGESKDIFIKRINVAAQDEEGKPDSSSPKDHWLLGESRNVGSIHSDIWRGSPAELAASNLIAIKPIVGWWRERPHLGRWGNQARYSLIVTISTPQQNIDLYTPVSVMIANRVEINV